MLIEKLKDIGLNENEAKVYLAALELGESTVQKISEKSGVKRVTTHVIVEKFINDGLFKEVVRGKRRKILADAPEKLLQKIIDKEIELRRQEEGLRSILPELASVYNYLSKKPKVRYYDGLEGIKSIYEDTLKQERGSVLYAFLSASSIDKRLLKWIKNDYVWRRVKKGIKAMVILPADDSGKLYNKEDKNKLRESLLLPPKDFPFSMEINIYQNRVALISNNSKDLFGLIIESREVANTFRLIFNLAWTTAKNISKSTKGK